MAIVKDYLDPNAASYTDDQIVAKVNAATAQVTRTSAVNADAVADGTTNKVYTGTEKTKLTGIETGATADQTATEIRDAIVGLTDDTRQIVISRPTTGQYKIYAIQKHTDGKTEVERNSVAS